MAAAGRKVEEVVREFMEIKGSGWSKRSYDGNRLVLARFVARFRGREVDTLQAAEMTQWVKETGGSERTRVNLRGYLTNLFHFAKNHNYLDRNRATEADFIYRPEPKDYPTHAFTLEEMSQLFLGLKEPHMLYLAICGFAGLRPSECAELEWGEDIDVVHRRISLDETKTTLPRIVPMTDKLIFDPILGDK